MLLVSFLSIYILTDNMKVSIRLYILLIYFRTFYKDNNSYPLVKIANDGAGVKSILFLLPNSRKEAQMIAHFIKWNNHHSIQFNYLFHEKGLYYYEKIPKNQIITFNDNDVNYIGFIKNDIIRKKIGAKKFDAIVDLNQSYKDPLSISNLQLKAGIKIGFESPISHSLYTVVIQPNQNGFIETNYQMIKRFLGIPSSE